MSRAAQELKKQNLKELKLKVFLLKAELCVYLITPCPSPLCQCGNMAREGLRTLVVAKKSLSEEQYQDFEVWIINTLHAVLGYIYTETKRRKNRIRYQKSLPSTRYRLMKRVLPHETARPTGDAVVHMPGL